MSIKPSVKATEIRLYTYCPRLYFFEVHLGARRPLKAYIRMLLGRLAHIFQSLVARLRGYRVEELLEADLGKVVVRGRPDYYKAGSEPCVVFELKTGRGPPNGAWLSDIMQTATYSLILARRGCRTVIGVIRYRGSTYSFKLTSSHVSTLFRVIDDVILVKDHGVLPYPLRSYRKCIKCPYKLECFLLDKGLEVEVEEPGLWLKKATT